MNTIDRNNRDKSLNPLWKIAIYVGILTFYDLLTWIFCNSV